MQYIREDLNGSYNHKEIEQKWQNYWEENNNIVAIIFPDGDSCNTSIKNGYEYLFKEMLDLAEQKLLPLFTPNENGKIDFLVDIIEEIISTKIVFNSDWVFTCYC